MPYQPAPQEVDEMKLRQAVAVANLPTLLMVLHQLTGDVCWIRDPFRPTRTKGVTDNDSGGFSDRIQEGIREAAVQAILDWASGTPVAIEVPTNDLLREMMNVCMGEPVPEEYVQMMTQEMDFGEPDDSHPLSEADVAATDLSVIVIGAGVAGLTAALKLREAGIRYVVLEKNSRVGGTWLENRYPGCGVDTPSYLYSFSFFSRPWSGHYGKRNELEAYVEDMARNFDLLPSIRFGNEVISASYDEQTHRWKVVVVDEHGHEDELVAPAVITAVGQLNRPKLPELPGMDTFRGSIFHSARWPDDLDVTGKRVAVVGTGASAMQIVPAIAERVEQLTIFQRSPQWAAPSPNYFRPIGDDVHWLMENVPFYHAWYRFRLAWIFNDRIHASLQIDPN